MLHPELAPRCWCQMSNASRGSREPRAASASGKSLDSFFGAEEGWQRSPESQRSGLMADTEQYTVVEKPEQGDLLKEVRVDLLCFCSRVFVCRSKARNVYHWMDVQGASSAAYSQR